MKSLFPEMDREIREGRVAQTREARQHARHYLKSHAGYVDWMMKLLRERGPQLDVTLMFDMSELVAGSPSDKGGKVCLHTLAVAHALWQTGTLWRREFDDHPCGETCYLYGIRGLHDPKQAQPA